MTRENVARSRRSWPIALVVVAVAAIGIGVAVFSPKEAAQQSRDDVTSIADASVDGHARVSKRSNNKRTGKTVGRAGKTHVAAHGSKHAAGAATGHRAGSGVGSGGRALGAPAGSSYESALGSSDQQLGMGPNGGPDLTDAQLAEPMSDGTFVGNCGAPDSMSVTVKVAIRMGRAIGVSVYTAPPAAEVGGCIDRHVRALSWPANPKTDSFVTTY